MNVFIYLLLFIDNYKKVSSSLYHRLYSSSDEEVSTDDNEPKKVDADNSLQELPSIGKGVYIFIRDEIK